MTRTFEDSLARRERMPLILGIVGPSGTGKTFSALRLATGIQRVVGGDIHVIDTEARRAMHYAPKAGEKANPAAGTFDFRHVAFGAPFHPLDYLAAIEHCVRKGAKTVIVDSMSHEHEGPGGVLELHGQEVERMAGNDAAKAKAVNMLAWVRAKKPRRRMINTLLQLECNFIFCFRAKSKLDVQRGKEPAPLGYMPISGDEFIYEMVLKFLLLPGAEGRPTWRPMHEAEREMVKIPEQFRSLLQGEPKQISEDLGEWLAKWGAAEPGTEKVSADDLLRKYAACSDSATLRALEDERRRAWPSASPDEKQALKKAADDAKEAVDAANAEPAGNAP